MSLSLDTQTRIIEDIGFQPAGQEFINAITNKVSLSNNTLTLLQDALTLNSAAAEVNAALVSGATLSLDTQKRICVWLTQISSGMEVINAIQTVPSPNVVL